MLELELAYEDGSESRGVYVLPLSIGRDAGSGIRLKSWRVARQHARISLRGGLPFVEDLGSLSGTFVNGRRVTQHGPLAPGDEIIIGPCRIVVVRLPESDRAVLAVAQGATVAAEVAVSDDRAGGTELDARRAATDTAHIRKSDASDQAGATFVHADAAPQAGPARGHSRLAAGLADAASSPADMERGLDGMTTPPLRSLVNEHLHHRRRLHKMLLEALDLRRRDILVLSDEALRCEAAEVLSGILAHDEHLPAGVDRADILRQVVDEAVGLGPLEPLLADRSVSEIMVNAHDEIYVERAGRLVRHDGGFSSEPAVTAVIDRIVAPLGRRVDEASPMVDARLRDGSRVNAVIPPIALRGACLTIRKFPARRLEIRDLLHVGSLDIAMAAFLEACVVRRKSVLVSGGTGSGKTTLLNVLSNCIPAGERVITIEDAAELRLNHAHLVSLESRPANAEGQGRVEIRDLVRNALRMRPDRIIVGECRGAEAFDMLSAMNTGHEGSLTTLHANSPRDALARLETMILMAGMDLPLAAIREHIASAVDLIVQQARLSDGRRLVTAIVEVTGMEAGRIQTQDLFRYRDDAEPRFEGCGVLPECFQHDDGPIPLDWLNQSTAVQRGAAAWIS